MKIYTCYTPSHKEMFEKYFLNSCIDEYEIIADEFPQECQSGSYMQNGWMNTMNRKIDLILRAIHQNKGEWFIHSDCDVQFLKPSLQYIKDNLRGDIVLQSDIFVKCAGFFACNANDRMLGLFNLIKKYITNFDNDQTALNFYLNNYPYVEHSVFDNKVWTVAMDIKSVWNDDMDFNVPQETIIHHANWTVGTENKMKLMELVRQKLNYK